MLFCKIHGWKKLNRSSESNIKLRMIYIFYLVWVFYLKIIYIKKYIMYTSSKQNM